MRHARLGSPAPSRPNLFYTRRRETSDLLAQLDNPGRSVCDGNSQAGVHTAYYQHPASDQHAPVMRVCEASNKTLTGEHRYFTPKEGNREGRRSRQQPRFLLPYIRHKEKRLRENEDDPQPGTVQRAIPICSTSFSNDNFGPPQVRNHAPGLAGQPGYSGRLPSCPNQASSSQVSPFFLRGQSLPVGGPPVWHFYGPVAVYTHNDANNQVPPPTEDSFRPLHRRLSPIQRRQSVACQTEEFHDQTTTTVGVVDQHGEIVPQTFSATQFHWRPVQNRRGSVVCAGRSMAQDIGKGNQGFVPEPIPSRVAIDIGTSDISTRHDDQGQTVPPTTAKVSQSVYQEKQPDLQVPAASASAGVSEVVDSPIECLRRRLFERIQSRSGVIRGRLPAGLGRTPRRPYGFRSLVRGQDYMAHKQSGIRSCDPGDTALGRETGREKTVGSFRQLNSRLVHQESGINQISQTSRADLPVLRTNRQTPDNGSSTTHSRVHKRVGRCPIKTRQTNTNRVDATQRSIQSPMPTISTPLNRPLCNQQKQTPTDVCIPSARSFSLGGRRSLTRLGGTGRLRIPTTGSSSQNGCKDQDHSEAQTDFSRSLVAGQDLVPRSIRTKHRRSMATTRVGKCPRSSTQPSAASRPGEVPSSRLGYLQGALKAKGFSSAAAKVISRAHRASTRSLYDDKWGTFVKFCQRHDRDPLTATPQFLAEFLLFLRKTRRLKGGTIATYLAALNTVLAVKRGQKISKIPELLAMLKAFKQEDMRAKFRPPAWDLNVVLRHLRQSPYEPLDQAPFEALTRKTAFLLALATAARVSEIHAIDVTRIRFEQTRHGAVHLGLCWDFLAKNQLPGQPDRTFLIPPLSSIVGSEEEEELFLCPVRALKEYLRQAEPRRKGRKRLFLPISSTSRAEVSRNTLALWLRSTILAAYDSEGLDHPVAHNPHEIRALASTMALHRNCSIPSIMEGCFWKSNTVFASHYLRDLAVADVEGLQSFGPLVVAQQLTRSQRPQGMSTFNKV